ncbi:MAG: CbiX/SirB N-terminal domain-containing protein [Dehalococcoidia bacterium]
MTAGVLLVAHGSHLHAGSSAPAHAHARRLRQQLPSDIEVRTAFWKEEPALSRALESFSPAVTDVTVVPLFIAGGYFTRHVIPREMRLSGRLTNFDGRLIRYVQPIGGHPSLARAIVQRAMEAGATGNEALVVLGHGTPRDPNSSAHTRLQAEHVRHLGAFPEVTAAFIDQDPNMRDIFTLVKAKDIFMVPLFIADGWHVGETIPDDLRLDGAATVREGRSLRFAKAVGTHPAVTEVILELFAEAAQW